MRERERESEIERKIVFVQKSFAIRLVLTQTLDPNRVPSGSLDEGGGCREGEEERASNSH